jgi:hypothetical protein
MPENPRLLNLGMNGILSKWSQVEPGEAEQIGTCVAEVVQRLKGGTSRVIRKEYPELEEFLWGDSFWADGYFAKTVGNVDEDVVRRYIREQRR